MRALRRTEGGAELIAVYGKNARRSFDSSKGKSAIHMVSVWANKNRLVLAQAKVEDKSNEIEATPQLLDLMEIQGCIVTIDAMGTQKKIAQRIREGKAEYVLALKAKQGTLLENVKLYLDDALARSFRDVPYDSHTTVEKDHGRFEEREYWVSSELSWLPEAKGWKDMQSIGMVRATRQIKGESQTETRYYISSLPADAKGFAEAVRAHWGVENSLHWVLDIAFREDESRIRKDNSYLERVLFGAE